MTKYRNCHKTELQFIKQVEVPDLRNTIQLSISVAYFKQFT